MTRGDQRERDRAKNMAKLNAGKKKQSGDPNARREADAKALQEKIAAKKAAAEGGGDAATKGGAKKK
ncbi:hypothetical protein Q8F55_002926 [Vanrija albida]|uniref:Small EDRK-rich factor-like N-terminal domain-containing protein n=1 Tax=Vanrija albida TaxID=181172 RepID=A0ABR3QBB5_9TREE